MFQLVIVTILILLSGLFSGLNLGLLSLDPHELKRKISFGDKDAAKIYPIRKNGNLLLVTLLLGNVAVNASISLILGSITSGLIAGFVSTALITLFGEIIPQAAFARYGLEFGARMTWLVYIFLIIMFPVAYPIAYFLDKALGHELPDIYSKQELIKIIEEHRESKESDLDHDEHRIASGALTFSDKKVKDVMTPRHDFSSINKNQILTKPNVHKLMKSGHSRFPVFDPSTNLAIGILFAKDLIMLTDHNLRAKQVMRKGIETIDINESLDHTLSKFIKTKRHLFIALDQENTPVGIITIEDILEEILGQEIIDEFDAEESALLSK